MPIETQEKIKEAYPYLLKLLVAGIVFRLIIFADFNTEPIQEIYAIIIGVLLLFTGIENQVTNIIIATEDKNYIIVQDCLGWKSIYLYASLILATTTKYVQNIKYVLAGTIILIVANFLRVYTTIILSELQVISFDIIHDVLWQSSLALVTFVLWYYWYANIK